MNNALSLACLVFASGAAVAAPAFAQTAAGEFPSDLTGPVLAAWIPAHTSLRLADVISVGGGRIIALTDRSQPAGSAKALRITIRTEIVDPEQAKAAAARSESSELDIDCAQHKARLVVTQTYSQRDLMGALVTKPGWAAFTSAAPNTTLDRMINAACDPAFRGTFAAAPRAAGVEPWPAAGSPGPARVDAPLPELRRAPSPVGDIAPDGPAPKPTAAAPKAQSASRDRFASLVQISASTSRAQAQASLDALKRSHPALAADRETLIEPTTVDGQTFYRALIGGFTGAPDARAFCAALKAAGGDCLVRQR